MRYLVTFCIVCFYTSFLKAQNTLVRINLYDETRYDNGLSSSDGLIIDFIAGGNNAVDLFDAPKFINLDESFARQNGPDLLSIERRDIPVDNEKLLLYNIRYRTLDYVFFVDAFQLPNILSFYKDTYTGELFSIGNGQNKEIRFSINNSIPASLAVNRFELLFIEKANYIYENAWSSFNPCTTAITATDNLNIEAGVALIDCDLEVKNITVAAGAALQMASGRTLTVNGDIVNLGIIDTKDASLILNNSDSFFSNEAQLGDLTIIGSNTIEFAGALEIYGSVKHSGSGSAIMENENATITFKSTANRNAHFIPIDLQITSPVVSETYMSAKRAYRFISSPITTTSSIFENWQESGNESIVGFGTDITGISGVANGFDVTATNNPSMYGWNNMNQNWIVQNSTNTITDVIEKGKPVRLFIRGDRQVDLTSNADAMRETVLRTKGIHTNTTALPMLNQTDGAFNMIGNPYLAPYDLDGMLSNQDVNGNPVDAPGTRPTVFYIWDPTLQSNGAYVTYDVAANLTTNSSSDANGFLQPYQAVFVVANGNIGDFTFREFYLDAAQSHVQISSDPMILRIELMNNQIVKDGTLLKFDSNFSNLIDTNDARKINNLEENLSVLEGQTLTSINARSLPQPTEVIYLNVEQLTTGIHELRLTPVVFQDLNTYLKDNFTGQSILLDAHVTTYYSFDWDNSNSQSSAASRFQLEFENSTLGVDDSAFAKAISIYPNPSNDGLILIELPAERCLESIKVFNTLGQKVMEVATLDSNSRIDLSGLKKGLYLLQLNLEGKIISKKVILE